LYAVLYPVQTHVDGLGAALLDGVVGDAGSTRIVGLKRSSRLWMAKFFKDNAKHGAILRIVEEGPKFGFGCRCHDGPEDGGVDMNRAVEGGRLR
jgi:hypothetical protein